MTAPHRSTSPKLLRILVVEDHTATGRTMAKLLRQRGHEVTLTATGVAGLLANEQREFDLVISDLGLPDVHGWALLPDLRAARPALRAIALSGFGQTPDVDRSTAAGFDLHLVKPARMAEIDAAILSLFPEAATTPPAPGTNPRTPL